MTVRVHLAEDHVMFREGLAAILASREGIEVVGQSGTDEEAVALVGRLRPDVVIAQLEMGLGEAEGVLSGIRAACPGCKIVAVSMPDNLRYVRAFSRMGVDAYLHKGSSSEELVATIRALSGHPDGGDPVVCMPRGLLERLGDGPVWGLSKRETEVLILAARGLSNRRIAAELHIAEPTVKTHLARVYRKVGAGSRTEAVRTALEEQWIGIHDVAHADGSSGG